MSPTRRDLMRFGAAALVGRALPQGPRPAAAKALPASTAVEALDHDPMREIVFRGFVVLMGEAEALDYAGMRSRWAFVTGFADGSGELAIQALDARPAAPWPRPDDYEPQPLRLNHEAPMVIVPLEPAAFLAFRGGLYGRMGDRDGAPEEYACNQSAA